jgi:lysyl-tRNA synthetase class 2
VSEDLRRIRLDKLAQLHERNVQPHPERFERTHTLAEGAALPLETKGLRLAGRLIAVRSFGKLTFAHLQDASGKLQIALEKKTLDADAWSLFHDLMDRGDFLGVEGELFETKKGEITLRVGALTFLGKALRPLPEKWHGLKDAELKLRRRYLDLLMGEETRERFRRRSKVIRILRRFLDDRGFEEVETPTLQTIPSGATARPFVTHHNALDIEVYLRIAPETWLKRLIVGGYDRVYELGRCFRNEGMDPSHLQEFTLLEYYCAYWNWKDNMRFTQELVKHLIQQVCGSLTLVWRGRELDFDGEWPQVDMALLVKEKTGIDLEDCPTVEALRKAVLEREIEIEQMESLGRGNLIDAVYKATVRDELIQPCFLTGMPADALPLARRNDSNPRLADSFQLIVNGWELVKAYSELVDPIQQRALFEEQERLRTGGDEEAMFLDEDYLEAMEYGMPPVSGWGMGIERVCALLSGSDSLRDVTLFPLLKPLGSGGADEEEADTSADVRDFPLTREEALALFKENVESDYLTKHCLASAAVMEAVAERFGKDTNAYWCIGLLHDLDFDRVKEPDKHTRETVRILKEKGVGDARILKAILAHNAEGLGDVERDKWLDYALSCSETITGLVAATALVMPDKKLASVKPSSVKKRMKKKDFARQVSREAIVQCEKIGLSLEEFCELAVAAMQKIAPELGL